MRFTFYKKEDGRWYIDLPNWQGEKEALEMVMGADTMLDILAQGENRISLWIQTNKPERSDEFYHIRKTMELGEGGGAYYIDQNNMEIWLCDVTLFVFDEFPENIYFTR